MKKSSKWMGVVAVALTAVMIFGTVWITGAGASTGVISQDEINSIINTTTDASKVSSPFTEVSNKVRNSIVGVNNYVTTTSRSFSYGYGFDGRQQQQESRESLSATGSGVVISSYGHILTNYHVVEGASRVTITVADDETEHVATVVGYDADLDIAILQVDGLSLTPVELGDSDQLQVGEWAIVIGNPLGEDFARSVTVGIVSALDREVTDSTYDRYGRRINITNSMVQVDAAINSGNSGGGMFNVLGQLQGIPARKYGSTTASLFSSSASVENIGMCIPINVAKPLIEQVMKEYSGVADVQAKDETQDATGSTNDLTGKPRLGVSINMLTGSSQGILPQGAIVMAVTAGSPAEEAGIQVGDIIVEIDGNLITSSTGVTDYVRGCKDGDTLSVKIYRTTGLAEQLENQSIDLSQIGDGEYIDFGVTLRVVDDVKM